MTQINEHCPRFGAVPREQRDARSAWRAPRREPVAPRLRNGPLHGGCSHFRTGDECRKIPESFPEAGYPQDPKEQRAGSPPSVRTEKTPASAGFPDSRRFGLVSGVLLSLWNPNVLHADEVDAFKAFVSSPPAVVEMLAKKSYPMSLSGSPPVFYRLAVQSNACLLRIGAREADVQRPLDQASESVSCVGCWNEHGWMLSPQNSNTMVLRVNHDMVHQTNREHRVPVNVAMARERIRALLQLGLPIPSGSVLHWDGPRFWTSTNAAGVAIRGILRLREGKVARADVVEYCSAHGTRRSAILYSYEVEQHLPKGIPTLITTLSNPDSPSAFLSSVLRVLSLKSSQRPLPWETFAPEAHLGTVNILRLREASNRVEVLNDRGTWENLVAERHRPRARGAESARRAFWVFSGIMFALAVVTVVKMRRARRAAPHHA